MKNFSTFVPCSIFLFLSHRVIRSRNNLGNWDAVKIRCAGRENSFLPVLAHRRQFWTEKGRKREDSSQMGNSINELDRFDEPATRSVRVDSLLAKFHRKLASAKLVGLWARQRDGYGTWTTSWPRRHPLLSCGPRTASRGTKRKGHRNSLT